MASHRRPVEQLVDLVGVGRRVAFVVRPGRGLHPRGLVASRVLSLCRALLPRKVEVHAGSVLLELRAMLVAALELL